MAWPPVNREPLGPPRERIPKLDKVGVVYSPPRPPKDRVDGFYWPRCDHKKPTQLRFLVSRTESDRLSREHMSNGRKLQFHMFGACVQLSAPDELFPGTSSRIVMISGFFYGTSLALDWLLGYLRSHLRYSSRSIRLIIPDRFCHVLTQNDNAVLKSIIDNSSTQIVVSPPNRYVIGLDRPVIVLGSHIDSASLLGQKLAVRFILSKLTEEPCYPLELASPYSYAGLKTKQTHIRFLVSPTEAETIMFYYGSISKELRFSLWGANIDLSREHEVFPGTSDRMVMVSGTCYNITMAVLGLSKLLKERQDTTKIRLIIPDKSCDFLCGKGGASMKSIMERSKAVIHVSPPDHNYDGLDRLVTVSGSGFDCYDKQMDAVHSILSKLTDDAFYPSHLKSPYTYADYLEEHVKPLDGGVREEDRLTNEEMSKDPDYLEGHVKPLDGGVPEEDRPSNEEMSKGDSKSNNDEATPDSQCVKPSDHEKKRTRNEQPKVTCTNDFPKIKTSEEEAKNQPSVGNEIRKMYGSAKDTLEVHREEHISRSSRLSADLLSAERSSPGLIDGNVSPWKYTGVDLHGAPTGTPIPGLRDHKIMDLVAW